MSALNRESAESPGHPSCPAATTATRTAAEPTSTTTKPPEKTGAGLAAFVSVVRARVPEIAVEEF